MITEGRICCNASAVQAEMDERRASIVYTDAERDRMLEEGRASGRQLPKGEGIQRHKGLGEMTPGIMGNHNGP